MDDVWTMWRCCGFRYLGKLSVGTMVMGYDDRDGFSIYYVDNEGVRSKGKRFAVGSGSTYAYRCVAGGGGRNRDMQRWWGDFHIFWRSLYTSSEF